MLPSIAELNKIQIDGIFVQFSIFPVSSSMGLLITWQQTTNANGPFFIRKSLELEDGSIPHAFPSDSWSCKLWDEKAGEAVFDSPDNP